MRKIIKSLILITVIVAMLIPFSACSNSNDNDLDTTANQEIDNNQDSEGNQDSENNQNNELAMGDEDNQNDIDSESDNGDDLEDSTKAPVEYNNEKTGLKITYPGEWFSFSEEELATYTQQADPEGTNKTEMILFIAATNPNFGPTSNMNATVQPFEILKGQGIEKIEDCMTVAETQLSTLYKQQGIEFTADVIDEVTINDIKMQHMHNITNAGLEFYQDLYAFEKDGNAIQIALTYFNDSEKEDLHEILNTISFSE